MPTTLKKPDIAWSNEKMNINTPVPTIYGKSFDRYSETWKKQIEHHFNHYKDLKKPGTLEVTGFGSPEEAWKVINECRQLAETQKWW